MLHHIQVLPASVESDRLHRHGDALAAEVLGAARSHDGLECMDDIALNFRLHNQNIDELLKCGVCAPDFISERLHDENVFSAERDFEHFLDSVHIALEFGELLGVLQAKELAGQHALLRDGVPPFGVESGARKQIGGPLGFRRLECLVDGQHDGRVALAQSLVVLTLFGEKHLACRRDLEKLFGALVDDAGGEIQSYLAKVAETHLGVQHDDLSLELHQGDSLFALVFGWQTGGHEDVEDQPVAGGVFAEVFEVWCAWVEAAHAWFAPSGYRILVFEDLL